MRRRKRTAAAGLAGLLLVGALTGCSSLGSQLQSSLTETTSAVRTAELGLSLRADDRATTAVTSTALTDALDELTSAGNAVTEIETSGSAESDKREQVLDLIRRSTDAVNRARTALTAGGSLASVTSDLADLGDEADSRLTQYQRKQAQ
jgi:hypothetical protein